MARALIALPLAVAGCFHATPYSPSFARDEWRAARAADEERANDAASGASPSRGAAGAEDAHGGLTADETYALALAHSPDVAMLAATSEVAVAEIQAARQLENPQLRLTSFNVDDVLANQPALNIGLRMPIPRPGTVRASAAAAQGAADGQQGLTDDAKRLLREQVDLRFAELTVLTADLEHAQRADQLRVQRREQLTERADLKVATRVDVAMAEVERARATQDVVLVRERIAELEEQLARLAGIRGPARFQPDPEHLRVLGADLDRDALVDQAFTSRPELRAAHALVVEAEAEAHVARAGAWPWFDWAQIQYRAGPGSPPTAFGFGVSLTLPVLSWNRGEIKASKALVRQRRAEQRGRAVVVADEVDAAAARVERTAARVLELERELLPAMETARREAEAAVADGALDPIVANEIEAEAVDTRREHLAALLEHRIAVVTLEAVVGAPLPAP